VHCVEALFRLSLEHRVSLSAGVVRKERGLFQKHFEGSPSMVEVKSG